MTQHDYLLCGWRVRSELELPELVPWPGTAGAPVDVMIREGRLDDRLGSEGSSEQVVSIGPDGECLLQIPGVVRILMLGGDTVIVDRTDPTGKGDWRLFLLGSAVSYLCLQKGIYPLHAACVRLAGHTVAIAGVSGSGKSTLSAALLQRGHVLLSDDLAALRPLECGMIETIPTFPRLKLWAQAAEALALPTDDLPRVRDGIDKFDLTPSGSFDARVTALDAVILLGEAQDVSMTLVERPRAIMELHQHLSRPRMAAKLGRMQACFTQAAAIVAVVPVYRLSRPKRFDAIEATIAALEAGVA